MIKKIFISIACFMLVLSCFFISPITANASTGQTYTYDDSELYSDTSNLGNYAIKTVESLTVSGSRVYKISFSIGSTALKFRYIHSGTGTDNNYSGNLLYFNSSYDSSKQIDCNIAFKCLTSTTGISVYRNASLFGTINGVKYYYRDVIFSANNDFEIYISSYRFIGNFDTLTVEESDIFSRQFNQVFNNDLSSFVDMDSSTNFLLNSIDLDFISSDSNKLSSYVGNLFKTTGSLFSNFPSFNITASELSSYNTFNSNDVEGFIYKGTSLVYNNYTNFAYLASVESVRLGSSGGVSNTFAYKFSDFYFLVDRPVYRTNNTLVFYNFDYTNFLYNVNSVTYQLQKGNDYYNVVYNGSLSNSYFVYISNTKVNNILFDNYIYVYLSFSDITNFYSSQTFATGENNQSIPLGFDFNFTYYNEPLVSSNGSYNFDFQKPGYVDMRFSLVPFYLPILEAVQNALIFLLFYCPIISDILAFIHLDQFFGALFNIFSFETGNISLLGINMGSFIWVCISFLIFFNLLRSFMPILWGSGKEVYSDLTYNSRTYKAEIANEKKKESYKKYKDKKNKKNQN